MGVAALGGSLLAHVLGDQFVQKLGYIHITVDDAPWHFIDASGETIILFGLEPGPHKVLNEPAQSRLAITDQQRIYCLF
jgi:hypothetical protein